MPGEECAKCKEVQAENAKLKAELARLRHILDDEEESMRAKAAAAGVSLPKRH